MEIKTFQENLRDYHYFMSVFKKTMKLKIDDHRRLAELLKLFTEGDARETLKCFIQQPLIRYRNGVFKLLLEQYHKNTYQILSAYKMEIKS